MIKYEELINPKLSKKILEDLCVYLELKYDERMLNEISMKVGDTKEKEPLTKQEVKKIYKIIEENNKILNYDIDKKEIKKSWIGL